MNQSARAVPARALDRGNDGGLQRPSGEGSTVIGGVKGSLPGAASAERRVIKLAINAPMDNVVASGWKATESHIIFFAKTR